MKPSLTCLKNHFVCFGAALFLLASVNAAKAQILLTIQLSGSEATITATGTAPIAGASIPMSDGVDLLGFFQNSAGDTGFNVDTTGLTTGDLSSGPLFKQAFADIYEADGNNDLELYDLASSATLTFTTGKPAFNGSLTVDLGTALPINSTGELVTGWSGTASEGGANVDIGSWQVVTTTAPEPSAWELLLVGFMLLAAYARTGFALNIAFRRSKALTS